MYEQLGSEKYFSWGETPDPHFKGGHARRGRGEEHLTSGMGMGGEQGYF